RQKRVQSQTWCLASEFLVTSTYPVSSPPTCSSYASRCAGYSPVQSFTPIPLVSGVSSGATPARRRTGTTYFRVAPPPGLITALLEDMGELWRFGTLNHPPAPGPGQHRVTSAVTDPTTVCTA